MIQTLGMAKKGFFIELLSFEATIASPSEAVKLKIQNLSGLLDLHSVSPNWRNVEKKPENSTYRKTFRNDSFQSLPSLSSPLKNSSRNSTSSESLTSRSTPKSSQPSPSFTKYVSKYKNSEAQVKDTILNTIILSKLNKFSSNTYDDIRDFLYQILGSTDTKESEEFIKEFMNLVFKKAVSEEIFCPLYAKLLGDISEKFPIILDEMNKLHENYIQIFDECAEDETSDYDSFVIKNREKKYRQGYSQFLSELTSLRILSASKLITTYNKIIEQLLIQGKQENKTALTDEYIDCLQRITKVLRQREEPFFKDIRNKLFDTVNLSINDIQLEKEKYKSISNKSRFLLLNIQDYLKGIK
jgi:hypothetical protein